MQTVHRIKSQMVHLFKEARLVQCSMTAPIILHECLEATPEWKGKSKIVHGFLVKDDIAMQHFWVVTSGDKPSVSRSHDIGYDIMRRFVPSLPNTHMLSEARPTCCKHFLMNSHDQENCSKAWQVYLRSPSEFWDRANTDPVGRVSCRIREQMLMWLRE